MMWMKRENLQESAATEDDVTKISTKAKCLPETGQRQNGHGIDCITFQKSKRAMTLGMAKVPRIASIVTHWRTRRHATATADENAGIERTIDKTPIRILARTREMPGASLEKGEDGMTQMVI
jgi:hypothetical protein